MKKIIALLLLIIVMGCFTACKRSKQPDDKTTDSEPVSGVEVGSEFMWGE